MGIQIVSSATEFVRNISGVDFTLRRLTERDESSLRRDHTRRGEMDMTAYTAAKLRLIVKGWGPGVSIDGQERAFDAAYVWDLPDSVKTEIFEAVNEGRPTPPPGPRSVAG